MQVVNAPRLGSLYLAISLDTVCAGMIIPFLTFQALEMKASDFQIGMLGSAWSLFYMIGTVMFGFMSKWFGCRKLLIASFGATGAVMLCYAFAENVTHLLFCRAISGFFSGAGTVSELFVANSVSDDDRPGALAKIGAAMGAALVLGPAAGALLAQFGFSQVALCGVGIAVINSIISMILLPCDRKSAEAELLNTEGNEPPAPTGSTASLSTASLFSILMKHKVLIMYFLSNFLFNSGFGMYTGISALFYRDMYGWGPTDYAVLTAMAGATLIILHVFFTRRIVAAVGQTNAMCLGAILKVPAYAALVFFRFDELPYIVITILICGSALFQPAVVSLISSLVPQEHRGVALGLHNGLGSLGTILGPTISGGLYQSDKYLPIIVAGWITLAGGMVSVLTHLMPSQAKSSGSLAAPAQTVPRGSFTVAQAGSFIVAPTVELGFDSEHSKAAPLDPRESELPDAVACMGA